MINALNSGARVFMADYEDANSPTWQNVVDGQRNVSDAIRRTISFDTPEKSYRLNDEVATLMIRPRGWHLPERHVLVDGEPVSASLFDFGLHMFRNAREQLERGSGPYFYLPKLESHREARLWAHGVHDRRGGARDPVRLDPLHGADRDDPRRVRDGGDPPRAARLGLRPERRPLGLHLQRDQEVPVARGLGAARPGAGDDGRAVHARLHGAARPLLPPARRARDRRHGRVHPVAQGRGRERPRAREGARGQGARVGRRLRRHLGRASRISSRSRPRSSTACSATGRTRSTGCARTSCPTRRRSSPSRTRPARSPSRGCARTSRVGIRYLDAWLQGVGAAAIDNLMEDAATAEISRSQVWQWVRAGRFDEARVRHEIELVEAGDEAKTAVRRARARAASWSSSSRFPRTLTWSDARQHEGRRHRAGDRGGDRLRRVGAGDGAPPGTALRAVRGLAHPRPGGAAPPRRARARLVRAEPRRPRPDDLARGAARGVHGARRARRPRHRGGGDEDHATTTSPSSTRARSGSRRSRRSCARASRARGGARSWATGCARTTRSTT